MTRLIAVVSGKGGVGKTTTAINLGTALVVSGEDIIVLDGNLTAPNVGLYLGVTDPEVTLHDIMKGRNMREATYMHASGLKVIPGSIRPDALKKLEQYKLKKAFRQLQGTSESVIIDTGAGLTKESMAVMNLAEEVIAVTNPELAAVTDTLKIINRAEKQNKQVLGVVINRYREENEMSMENVEAMLDRPVLAVIPESDDIRKAQAARHPAVYITPGSEASLGFISLAEKLKLQKA